MLCIGSQRDSTLGTAFHNVVAEEDLVSLLIRLLTYGKGIPGGGGGFDNVLLYEDNDICFAYQLFRILCRGQ